MEENSNYTYTYKKKAENNRLFFIAVGALAVLLILAIVIGAVAGKSSAKSKFQKEKAKEEATTVPRVTESTTVPEETSPYPLGEYKVNTGSNAINFRKGYTTSADILFEIADGTTLTITDIYRDTQAEAEGSDVIYWGQAKYNGSTGWVAMNYLQRVAAPTENTTAEGETGGEVTTQPGANANANANAKYQPGEYSVNTDGVGLRFKKTPAADGDVITLIPSGTRVTVLSVVEVEADDEVYRYWGEVRFNGNTGYLSMVYLKSVN